LNFALQIAESFQRNPIRFAILLLIQRALLPHLLVLAPKNPRRKRSRVRNLSGILCPHFQNLSVRTDRVRTTRKQPRKIWTLTSLGCNSLIPFKNSLILKLFSLIICLGNCSRSGCSTAVSWHQIVSLSPRIAEFPVKFPDTREFAWRLVRSALRRQPGSPATRNCGSGKLTKVRSLLHRSVMLFRTFAARSV
jgi:hypothetical protein